MPWRPPHDRPPPPRHIIGPTKKKNTSGIASQNTWPWHVSLAHASLVVGELAGVGLVERNHDERDRRRIIVSLSDAARPAVAQMRDRHAGSLRHFLADLDDDQADWFIDQLSRLVACLRDEETA